MKKFKRFVRVENLEESVQSDQNAIQEKIEDYVSDRKHKIIFK